MPNLNNIEQVTEGRNSGHMSSWDIFVSLAVPYVLVKMWFDPHDGSTPLERGAAAMEKAGNIAVTLTVWFILIIVGLTIYHYVIGG